MKVGGWWGGWAGGKFWPLVCLKVDDHLTISRISPVWLEL